MNPERIKRRIASLSTPELMDWANLAVSGMMKHLDDFRRSPDETHLGEVSLAAVTLGYVVDDLAERTRNARPALDSRGHGE